MGGEGEVSDGYEWEAEGGLYHPLAIWHRDRAILCLQQSTKTATVYMSGQDGHWQQFDTTCSLISAPQWHHTPCSGLLCIRRVRKMLPVKADLAICSPVIGVYSARVWLSCQAINWI